MRRFYLRYSKKNIGAIIAFKPDLRPGMGCVWVATRCLIGRKMRKISVFREGRVPSCICHISMIEILGVKVKMIGIIWYHNSRE